jgi:hypothetical protein
MFKSVTDTLKKATTSVIKLLGVNAAGTGDGGSGSGSDKDDDDAGSPAPASPSVSSSSGPEQRLAKMLVDTFQVRSPRVCGTLNVMTRGGSRRSILAPCVPPAFVRSPHSGSPRHAVLRYARVRA